MHREGIKSTEGLEGLIKAGGENKDGAWGMTDSCGDRVVSLCRLRTESTGKF